MFLDYYGNDGSGVMRSLETAIHADIKGSRIICNDR